MKTTLVKQFKQKFQLPFYIIVQLDDKFINLSKWSAQSLGETCATSSLQVDLQKLINIVALESTLMLRKSYILINREDWNFTDYY